MKDRRDGGSAAEAGAARTPSGTGTLAITLAAAEEADDVAALLVALDAHYLGPASGTTPDAARAMVLRTLSQREGTRFAVARRDGRPVALACFATIRPGHALSGVLWLKDLFVVAEERGRGVGRAMLAFVAGLARREGIGRIDLTTERGNAEAQRFYERLGGVVQPKVFFRFEGDALAILADQEH